jgi:hypothetical protein
MKGNQRKKKHRAATPHPDTASQPDTLAIKLYRVRSQIKPSGRYDLTMR